LNENDEPLRMKFERVGKIAVGKIYEKAAKRTIIPAQGKAGYLHAGSQSQGGHQFYIDWWCPASSTFAPFKRSLFSGLIAQTTSKAIRRLFKPQSDNRLLKVQNEIVLPPSATSASFENALI
jgi:hypothetical protein